MATTLRLQKYIASCGIASRRKAEEYILEGRVKVNGKTITCLSTKVNPHSDQVLFDAKPLKEQKKGILILNKPRAVVSTMKDPEGRKCINDYINKRHRGFFPVGRLDYESSGLVILTNHGALANYLLHPKYEVSRLYKVKVEGRVSENSFQKLAKGVLLDDGLAKAHNLHFISDDHDTTWFEIEIREGRNRMIRRMCEEIGHPVIHLIRLSHGPIKLGSLPVGQIRTLTEKEIERVLKSFNLKI